MSTIFHTVSLLGHELRQHSVTALLLGIVSAISFAYICLYGNRSSSGFPVLDAHLPVQSRVQRWLTDTPALLNAGYTKYPGKFWVAQTGDGPLIMAPQTMLDELRKLPDSVVSAPEGAKTRLATKYSMIHAEFSPVRLQVLQHNLTPQIANLMPDIADEVEQALADEMPGGRQWTHSKIYDIILRVVARTSGRVFVGLPFCRNEEWIDVSINYTMAAFGASSNIKKWRPLLRPFVYRFQPQYRDVAQFHERAKALILPIVQERLKSQEEARQAANHFPKPNDMVQWFLDAASEAQRRDDNFMTEELLTMSMAAIHTTTMGVTQTIYELAARPEYIGPLRDELRAVLGANDGLFSKTSMEQFKKLDSFMKETNRFNPPATTTWYRKIMRDITLSDGTTLRAGSYIDIPIHAIAFDPKLTEDAATFKGFRWAEQRANGTSKEAARAQYVAVSDTAMQFGWGRHACPGRFFAANEIKIILANLLLKYDVQLPDDAVGKYPNLVFDNMIVPDRTKDLLLRKREE